VRKALFLEPYHQEQVYYPDASETHWYLVLDHTERAKESFFDEPVLDPEIHDLKFHGVPDSRVTPLVATTPGKTKIPGSDGNDGSSHPRRTHPSLKMPEVVETTSIKLTGAGRLPRKQRPGFRHSSKTKVPHLACLTVNAYIQRGCRDRGWYALHSRSL
jgi:hypothetical protein